MATAPTPILHWNHSLWMNGTHGDTQTSLNTTGQHIAQSTLHLPYLHTPVNPPTFTQTSIVSSLCTHPTQHAPTMMTAISTLSDERRRNIGDILLPPEAFLHELCRAFQNGTALCVCDGSLNDLRGSHAWILLSLNERGRIEGAGPADGNPDSIASYQPELQGFIALLTLLCLITSSIPCQGSIKIACDNDSAVRTIANMLISPQT